MTEVLFYPLGAFALLAIARAVETATLRDQAIAFGAIALTMLTSVQAVVLVAVFAAAIVVDWLFSRERRTLRSFWPVWSVLAAAGAAVAAAPGLFGAYEVTLRGHYPLGPAARLIGEHFSYLALSTAVAPVVALALLLFGIARGDERDPGARAVVSVAVCATVLVVVQVGLFAARYAPHLLGRDLALLPPLLFTVFALWLDRGAPRPRPAVFLVALSVLAMLLLTPWNHLVNVDALPDTFDIVILDRLGGDRAAWAVAAVALLLVVGIVTLHRRFLVALPVAMIVLLIGSSAVASNNLAARVAYDQHNLVGIPQNWIVRATHAPTAYFYDGESYWNGVWQVRFWNRNIGDVVSAAPARVPGPMPQRVIHVPATGLLPIKERYVVASDPHSFAGTPVAHLAQLGLDTGGLTVWHLTGRRG